MICATPFPVGLDGQWHAPPAEVVEHPGLSSWLLHTGSLTARLQSHCHHFRLQKLGQGAASLHASEQHALGDAASAADVREVILWGDEQPWVFARSVIPHALVNTLLADLGDRPLGELLFNHAAFSRGPFELCQWPLQSLKVLFPTLQGPEQLWARRSDFHYQGLTMLVAELFLPASPLYWNEFTHASR